MQYGSHSDKQFTCEECSKPFPRKDNLAKHVKMVHEKRKYTCAICGETFSVSKIKSHYQRCKEKRNVAEKAVLNLAFEDEENVVTLEAVKQSFANSFVDFVDKYLDKDSLDCQQCQQTFNTANLLKVHRE